jgi:hypothetical protein
MTCRRLDLSCCNWISHRSDSVAGSEACRRGLRREFHHIHFSALDYSCKQVSSLRFPRICDIARADPRCFRGFSDVVRLLIRNSADVNHFVSSCDTNLIMQVLLLLFISDQSPRQTPHCFSAVPAMRPHICCIILQPSFLPNLLESPHHSVRAAPPSRFASSNYRLNIDQHRSSYSSSSSMQDVSSAPPVHRCPFCKSSSMRDNSTDDHAGLTALHASVQKVSAMSRRVYHDYVLILFSSRF